ncbi:WbqC family protein [Streptomyces cyaneofuscatus]|uniref:WbqC family protein n=1 Tax=Streptomyces cyaneofuscatus TaxID=66883 RepID=UPI0013DA5A3F|nr:WbqC family protein [Streptomyces cyaneofuscatus]NDZ65293.1 WbqC family protein [Streptomyces cyaneofuscatus]
MDTLRDNIERLSAICRAAGAVIAALLAMHYIDPIGARATFDEILHRRTHRGREAAAAA